jgi:hypothetical protein
MATRRVVTRTAANAQPLPRLIPRTPRQEKQFNLSDTTIVVKWLNAAKDAKAIASYERVESVRRQLEEFRALRVRLQDLRNNWPASKTYREHLKTERSPSRAGQGGNAVYPPSIETKSPSYKKLYLQMEKLHSSLNQALDEYTFRPRLTYYVYGDEWLGGIAPDEHTRWFETKINSQRKVNEADAVLSLVRLDLIGAIGTVALCEMCRVRWYARVKKNYKFCPGSTCREAFYAKDPDFRKRKAKAQRKYRLNLKRWMA